MAIVALVAVGEGGEGVRQRICNLVHDGKHLAQLVNAKSFKNDSHGLQKLRRQRGEKKEGSDNKTQLGSSKKHVGIENTTLPLVESATLAAPGHLKRVHKSNEIGLDGGKLLDVGNSVAYGFLGLG